MSKKSSPFFVGSFVLGAIVLFVFGLVVFGSGKFFTKENHYVIFFDGSVQGLREGARVAVRGVSVGTVARLHLLFDKDDIEATTEVIISILPEKIRKISSKGRKGDVPIELLIKRGLRAQLKSESLLTGLLFVNLDFHPETEVKLAGLPTKYREIPAIPSQMEQLAKMFSAVPLDKLVKDLDRVLTSVGDISSSPGLKKGVDGLGELIEKAQKTLVVATNTFENIDKEVVPVSASFRKVAVSLDEVLSEIEGTLKSLQGTMKSDSEFNYEVKRTLESVTDASRAVKSLANYLERNPNSIIRGKRGN